ncbi:uncharacterized protein LY79DRAFT_41813 [Colletotrichum navitas]|uniref:Uncharacterized protein n=1 Tax=Colletotrichum navitas TaxID=681940 RepID=A0AAD8PMH2_9PEZI|nr:uncharacterized protein LY79DRAFT_41813 [Colletotrichum navitas]KAK1572815.1 hypothetical protein LY79DRAFT_41813 [Colletotrichum navitas]
MMVPTEESRAGQTAKPRSKSLYATRLMHGDGYPSLLTQPTRVGPFVFTPSSTSRRCHSGTPSSVSSFVLTLANWVTLVAQCSKNEMNFSCTR